MKQDKTKSTDTKINTDDLKMKEVTEKQENVDAKDEKETPVVHHEDNLELHAMSAKERRKMKLQRLRENMEDMSKWQKFVYIFSYYKWRFIIAIIIIAVCITLPLTIYQNKRPVALAYCIVNAKDPEALNTSFIDDYQNYLGLTGSLQIRKDLDVHLDKDTYLEEYNKNVDSSDYTEIPMRCFNGYYDVFIMDKKGVDYCAMQAIINPINNYLPADIYELVSDRLITSTDHDGAVVDFAIDISDTDFAKNLNLGYSPVYLGFPGTTEQNYVNAKRMLKYIFHFDIDTEMTY